MVDQSKELASDVDLDEDLFNFDEVMPDESGEVEDEIDLDAIFAAFQASDDAEVEEEEEEEGDDEAEEIELAEEPAPAAPAKTKPAPEPAVAVDEDEDELDDEEEDEEEPEEVAPPAPKRKKPRTEKVERAERAGRTERVERPVRRSERARRTKRREPAEPRPLAPRAVTFLTRGAVVVLISMTLLNVSIALVTFSSATGMRADLEAASKQMSDAALEIRDHVGEQTDAVKQQFSPVVAPTLDDNPTFDRAEADIQVGHFAQGRRRIYALLAVLDRQPPSLRQELEARAAFLLARSYHLEAQSVGGSK